MIILINGNGIFYSPVKMQSKIVIWIKKWYVCLNNKKVEFKTLTNTLKI